MGCPLQWLRLWLFPDLKARGFYGSQADRLQSQSENVYGCVLVSIHDETVTLTFVYAVF